MNARHVPLILCGLIAVSCRQSQNESADKIATAPITASKLLAPVLAPQGGHTRLDESIRQLQDRIRSGRVADSTVERLGWLFVAEARETFDPGYFKLAEQCAGFLESKAPRSPEALFLHGHALHNLHRFKEAEGLASQLVQARGLPGDFGLLGDALMEQGKLGEAAAAYQRMADLKPDLHALARAAHLRWLKGDLAGAMELEQMAAKSVSPHESDTAAWIWTRLAAYQFQAGAQKTAQASCNEAIGFRADYPPALLLRGRMLLAEERFAEAVPILRRATQLVPLPEYQWALAEALEANRQVTEAAAVETELRRTGAANDPRTMALFLATRGEAPAEAFHLAQEELLNRQDVFTEDALAWALAGVGRLEEARSHLQRALAVGTQDARLFFHAAVLARRAADRAETTTWLARASQLKALLLPSERERLAQLAREPFPDRPMDLAGAEKSQNKPNPER